MNKIKQYEELVWICAVRYALGRRTYVTSCVSNFMIESIPEMSEKTKSIMIRDIEECNDLGMDCDRKNWNNLLKKLK